MQDQGSCFFFACNNYCRNIMRTIVGVYGDL